MRNPISYPEASADNKTKCGALQLEWHQCSRQHIEQQYTHRLHKPIVVPFATLACQSGDGLQHSVRTRPSGDPATVYTQCQSDVAEASSNALLI